MAFLDRDHEKPEVGNNILFLQEVQNQKESDNFFNKNTNTPPAAMVSHVNQMINYVCLGVSNDFTYNFNTTTIN